MQILRRQPNDSSSNNRNRTAEEARRAKTLEEREEEYRLARERIFGNEGSGEAGRGSGRSSPVIIEAISSLGVVPSQVRRSPIPGPRGGSPGVVRQPRGPSEGGGFER